MISMREVISKLIVKTLEHLADDCAALNDFPVCFELHIVGADEDNHNAWKDVMESDWFDQDTESVFGKHDRASPEAPQAELPEPLR